MYAFNSYGHQDAKNHCNRLTTVQDIRDYASLVFWHAVSAVCLFKPRRGLVCKLRTVECSHPSGYYKIQKPKLLKILVLQSHCHAYKGYS